MLSILLLAFAADLAPPQMPALPEPVSLSSPARHPGCVCRPCTCADCRCGEDNAFMLTLGGTPDTAARTPDIAVAQGARSYVAQTGHYVTQCNGGSCSRVWVPSQPAAQTKRAVVPQVQVQVQRRWRLFR
jgi:hypothetical protein